MTQERFTQAIYVLSRSLGVCTKVIGSRTSFIFLIMALPPILQGLGDVS